MAKKKVALTRGERNIAWIEANCIVPEGKLVGTRVKLAPFQRDIILGIYNRETRRAIISFARKCGKTALVGMLLLLHLVGPEARPNSQLISSAMSREQAAIIFALAAKMVRMSPTLSKYVSVRDTAKQLYCQQLGTQYRALSADASTAYGLSPVFTVHDELGQVKGPRSALYEALETASAAHDNPLTIIISTQAPTDADLLSVLIDDALTGSDPKTKLFLYTAPDDLSPFSEDALRAANPAFDYFQNQTEMLAMAEDARRMPSREAEYRNLILNQRVEAISPFISKSIWDANAGAVADKFTGLVYAGLDLSETQDLTALVLVSQIDGIWHVKPTFWLPSEGLPEKARQDRVPYDLWAKQGYLATTPGKAIEYAYVAEQLYRICNEMQVAKIAFDRWNYRHLRPHLIQAGFSEAMLDRFVQFGQGFQSMSPALREVETLLLGSKVRHGGQPLLTLCAANASVETDPAGNRKLSKKQSRGRIDGMVSMAMALSVAVTTQHETPVFRSIWDTGGLVDLLAQNKPSGDAAPVAINP